MELRIKHDNPAVGLEIIVLIDSFPSLTIMREQNGVLVSTESFTSESLEVLNTAVKVLNLLLEASP